MRSSIIVSSLMSAALSYATTTGELGDATVIENNPVGPIYKATLLDKDDTEVRGSILATAANDGRGVIFDAEFWGFPDEAENGPFSYHIHVDPVPESGNCTETLAHLDPFIRGEDPPCDPSAPKTCQVGDLSGKHGKITGVDGGNVYEAVYTDLYASTLEGLGSFFGNRSIVVHDKDKKRLNCANFVQIDPPASSPEPSYSAPGAGPIPSDTTEPTYNAPGPGPTPSETPVHTPSGSPTPSPAPSETYEYPTQASETPAAPIFTGQASLTTFSAGAIMAAVAAMVW